MPLDNSWEPKGEHTIITTEGPIHLNIRRIDSSNIEWIGWPKTGQKKGSDIMVVSFKNAARYIYFGVSRQMAVACAYAESSGVYLNKVIKPRFGCLKVR